MNNLLLQDKTRPRVRFIFVSDAVALLNSAIKSSQMQYSTSHKYHKLPACVLCFFTDQRLVVPLFLSVNRFLPHRQSHLILGLRPRRGRIRLRGSGLLPCIVDSFANRGLSAPVNPARRNRTREEAALVSTARVCTSERFFAPTIAYRLRVLRTKPAPTSARIGRIVSL